MRTGILHMRVDEAAKRRWGAAAAQAGISLSAWVERACDRAADQAQAVPEAPVPSTARPVAAATAAVPEDPATIRERLLEALRT